GRSRKRKPRRKPGRSCRRPGETTGRRLPGSGEAGALRASLFLAGLALEGRLGADLAGGAGGARRIAVTALARCAIGVGMEARATLAALGARKGRCVLFPGFAGGARRAGTVGGLGVLSPGLVVRLAGAGRPRIVARPCVLLPGLAGTRRGACSRAVLVPRLAALRTCASGGLVLVGGPHGPLGFQAGNGFRGNGLADEVLDAANLVAFGVHGQRDGLAVATGAAGAADAVHVVFGLQGQV